MPLNPQIEALLAGIAASGQPPLSAGTPERARLGFGPLMALLPPSTKTIASAINRTIDGPGGALPLRIYTPVGQGPFAILMYFHGGGFVIGDLDSYDQTCRELCACSGALVISVDYRLAPEHCFPAATDDCLAATRWAAKHAVELGADASRIAVSGDSAGGNLAAVTALRIRDEGGPTLRAQLLLYPVTDHVSRETVSMRDNAEGYLLTREDMQWFAGHYLQQPGDRDDPRACPLRAASLAGLPPALVVTAEYDPLRDEGEAYAAALQKAGTACELSRYDGAIHGFFTFFSGIELGRRAMDQTSGWLQQKLV